MTQTAPEPAVLTAPRLLVGGAGRRPEALAGYRALGGYARGSEGAELVADLAHADLRGRGGAAFPTGVKLQSVADGLGPRCVVANGEEGEPASVKDRWLLRRRPHLVLDGLLRAVRAVDAEVAWVYVSGPEAARSVEAALAELSDAELQGADVRIHEVAAGYVAGEETAVVRALDGGPAKPVDKPPRPFEVGVGGRPTLVSNVETLAEIALIATQGVNRFREVGLGSAPGTILVTLAEAGRGAVLLEVPTGISLGAAAAAAGFAGEVRGVLIGGFFGGVLGPRALDLALDPDALRSVGSGLGCGAFVLLGRHDCPVGAAAEVMAYFDRENAGQCGACFRGTASMADVLSRLRMGEADEARLSKLASWATSLRGRGACGTLDAAANLAGSLLREFPDDIAAHTAGTPCADCARFPLDTGGTRFAAAVPPVEVLSPIAVP